MIRLISDRDDIKEKPHLNDFFSKIKLLIIMSKAMMSSYPLEEHRLDEIIEAAESIIRDCVDWQGRCSNFRHLVRTESTVNMDDAFFQRAKLLAVMAKSFAQGNPMGLYRLRALMRNIDELCEMLRYVPLKDGDIAAEREEAFPRGRNQVN